MAHPIAPAEDRASSMTQAAQGSVRRSSRNGARMQTSPPPVADLPPEHSAQLDWATPLATPTRLFMKFWGTRGSIPVSGITYQRYGGNTSCVSVTSDSGHLFIFDAGSGIRPLGVDLVEQAAGRPVAGYLLLSHSHWDHIQGFPFFQPVFAKQNRLHILGCTDGAESLADLLAGQMERAYFPVALAALPAEISFHSIHDGEHMLDGARIAVLTQKHTQPSAAFRLKLADWNLVYASDNEPLSPPVIGETLLGYDVIDRKLVDFARGADLLVHDAQYTVEEYPQRIGWGHNIPEVAVDTAIRAGVKCLALFHHDPMHSDEFLDAMLLRAQERARRLGAAGLEIISAHDEMELTF